MDFDLATWKRAAGEKLRHIGRWLDRRKTDVPYLTYGTLCGLSLWPLVEAAQAGQTLPVMMALGSVAGGVGGNLIAEQVGRWKDQADPVDEPQVTRWVVEHAEDAELREALDAIVEKLEALSQAQAGLGEADRDWFAETLRDELSRLGNLARYEATLIGSGMIVQDHSVGATSGGVAVGRDFHGDVVQPGGVKQVYLPPQEDDSQEVAARRRYLECLRRYCKALPLAALGGEEGADEDLTLDCVYIDLDTTTPVPLSEDEQPAGAAIVGRGEGASRPLAALEAAAGATRLALLGDPGAGKSTFARRLLVWLAEANLGEADPPPDIPGDLLPVFITLRDLAPRLTGLLLDDQPADHQRDVLAAVVRDHILDDLARFDCAAFAEGMRAALLSGQCWLALDGLDEVPHDLRGRVRQATAALIRRYELQRVLITCRVRSYVGQAVLPGFEAHTLAPFDGDKIRRFARAWYNTQRDLGRVDAEGARRKAESLAEAALGDDLREMSTNPMMLTTMAIIHQKEIGLPKERVRLYDLAVDVLLRRWQKLKMGERRLAASPALTECLKDDLRLRRVIERLAYEAHRAGQGGEGQDKADLTDLARGAALALLEAREYLGDAGLAAEFLDYVDQRAGLLVGRGGEPGRPAAYGFPHRVFQEYLAGCYMVGQRDATREFFARAGEGDYWSLAARLGAEELFYNRRSTGANTLLDLAYRLCPAGEPQDTRARRAVLWSGEMAALARREAIERDAGSPDGGLAYLECLIPRLVGLLASELAAPERAAAGSTLARLGDPRFRVDAWYLPDEPLLGFVEVPAGPFLMGTPEEDIPALKERYGGEQRWYEWEAPQHEVTLPTYYIARYPVTQAQFDFFVEAGGYREPRYWREAEGVGAWQAGRVRRRWREFVEDEFKEFEETADAPHDFGEPSNLPNHPLVGVTWYEALAYCRWLAEQLGAWEGLPEPLAGRLCQGGWQVRLPSEREWEKAARGGDGRVFPWGGEPDPNQANYADTGVGSTSAVGCFPGGASPYGCQDVSGNVWEWCATRWQDSYQDYRDDNDPTGAGVRVVRGGAFYPPVDLVRCAIRLRRSPDRRDYYLGFRIVVAPG